MVMRGTIRRFAHWGLTHGPAWGVLAALVGGIPLAMVHGTGADELQIVGLGLLGGIVVGPLLGAAVGLACAAADRAPKWILDAPDYVAVVTVTALVGAVTWPLLDLGRSGLPVGALGIVLLAGAPAIDAARSAPWLLHPQLPATAAPALEVAPPRQAS